MDPRRPPGIPYIIANEAAERFSYYGMKCILVVYMVGYLRDSSGALATLSDSEAKVWYHLFSASNYFFPIVGALVADIFWGKYRTIINLSVVYCLGHLALALSDTQLGLFAGLSLIAIGSGGIKPCVSAHLGDQFSAPNSHLLSRYYGWFYLAINGGALISTLATPWLLEHYGPHLAFGVPGALMLLATYAFYLGQKHFVTLPPSGWKKFKDTVLSPSGLAAVRKLSVLYLFMAVFWSVLDQTGSTWVLQAQHLDPVIDLRFGIFSSEWLRFEILPAQLQVFNPLLIFLYVPLFSRLVYPKLGNYMDVTALRKIGFGFVLGSVTFVFLGWLQLNILPGSPPPTIMWQVLGYFIITAAEVLVYWTGLELSYTQAPRELKSFIMGLFLLSIALGNALTAAINFLLSDSQGQNLIGQADYFFLFATILFMSLLAYISFAKQYQTGPPAISEQF